MLPVPTMIGLVLSVPTPASAIVIQVSFTASLSGTLGTGSIWETLGTYDVAVPGTVLIDPNEIVATISLLAGFDGTFTHFGATDPGMISVPSGYPGTQITIANLANIAVTYDFTAFSFDLSLNPGKGGAFETPSVFDMDIGGSGATAFGPLQITSTILPVPEPGTAALVSMGAVLLASRKQKQRHV
ncbi:MAG TPA: PEP-CTERM sorting domain-containing protein [Myxococcota bacterium]|nr:PEP-CTERM sorting domain-containing protein [Myxococcota bacterium]